MTTLTAIPVLFSYCRMWSTWRRILQADRGNTIAIGLHGSSAPRLYAGYVPHDPNVEHLPPEIVRIMRAEHGDELTKRLLHEDFKIDWDKARLLNNGGCPLLDVLSTTGEDIGERPPISPPIPVKPEIVDPISFEEAKARLTKCERHELRDHAFGDAEIHWIVNGDWKNLVAFSYVGRGPYMVSVYGPGEVEIGSFKDDEARALLKTGRLTVTRNDETGPDTFQPGTCMPALTLGGVLKELTGLTATLEEDDRTVKKDSSW